MNYFLGYFPDEKTNIAIRKIIVECGRIFDAQGIPVRWAKPEQIHLAVLFLGHKMSWLEKNLFKMQMAKVEIPQFEITLDTVNLGISKSYKELLYISVGQGGDTLRNLLLEISKKA